MLQVSIYVYLLMLTLQMAKNPKPVYQYWATQPIIQLNQSYTTNFYKK